MQIRINLTKSKDQDHFILNLQMLFCVYTLVNTKQHLFVLFGEFFVKSQMSLITLMDPHV